MWRNGSYGTTAKLVKRWTWVTLHGVGRKWPVLVLRCSGVNVTWIGRSVLTRRKTEFKAVVVRWASVGVR